MKLLNALSVAILAGSAPLASADIIFQDDFNGSNDVNLDGSAPDVRPGTETWAAPTLSTAWKADGAIGSNGSAWLPYAFGSGVYEVKLGVDLSGGLVAISFTAQPDPENFNTGYINDTLAAPYLSFALRGGSTDDFEFWRYKNTDNYDSGQITAGDVGILRVVLDTTGSSWTYDAFYDPDGADPEIVIDLNPDPLTTTYVMALSAPATTENIYQTESSTFTGVGFIGSGSSNSVTSFELSTIPEPSSMALLLAGGVSLLSARRKRA